ncbi:hypothetical protein COCC4DRAFT_59758 [Bipolaris maydis ATCC 48331]|uniref:Uncharacterized protein n=2 Tax=Cochliobolus heterostrophus TaxID=5016 RepID=M2UEP4_COCH5|nr:uncharacterized protein COCC4DRAFT_59758 [Bipolaris maydis ATCC 48331]EMD86332.1 hypothetical protein COCHEDRAFT_1218549 [Bipolaris maydis C5]ENI06279.1 hypothetical protein COCC4DRAFT_59758 [Bipolaris maydis ATCC 48331]KAH7551762.1 hypothetical protein BM1_09396 [Bipolaris maydis]
MQNYQTKHMSAPESSSNPTPDAQTSNGINKAASWNTNSSEQVVLHNTQESKETSVKEGKTAWHMERWLNETTKESTWSVYGRRF